MQWTRPLAIVYGFRSAPAGPLKFVFGEGGALVAWLSKQDAGGFLIAAVITTAPLFVLVWVGDNMSKDGPIGLPAYIIPGAISVFAAVVGSIQAHISARGKPKGLVYFIVFGCLVSFLLVISFFFWLGDYSFRFAEQFRS